MGGPFYITQLSGKVASSAHIEYHARIIAQKFLARELISFTSNIQPKELDETQDVDDLMQEAEGKLFEISQQDMKKEDFDLCESMRLALLSMEQKITDRGLDVEADIPEDSVMVQGVNDLITQVIYNLLENAAKFAAPGSTLYLGLTETGGDKAVEEIPLLFERFHKSDKSRSEDKDGYGLGLYGVKTILSQHKEKITVTSENGVTSFSFTVQLAHPMRNT